MTEAERGTRAPTRVYVGTPKQRVLAGLGLLTALVIVQYADRVVWSLYGESRVYGPEGNPRFIGILVFVYLTAGPIVGLLTDGWENMVGWNRQPRPGWAWVLVIATWCVLAAAIPASWGLSVPQIPFLALALASVGFVGAKAWRRSQTRRVAVSIRVTRPVPPGRRHGRRARRRSPPGRKSG